MRAVFDVPAVQHCENALAHGGDLAEARDVAVLEDDAPTGDHDEAGRPLSPEPDAQRVEARRIEIRFARLDVLPLRAGEYSGVVGREGGRHEKREGDEQCCACHLRSLARRRSRIRRR